MRPITIRTLRLLPILAVLGGLLAATAEPADAARCLGKRATIVGSRTANHIEGTDRKDVIVARGGNNVIDGHKGGDIVCGGPGNDRVLGDDFRRGS